MIAAIQSQNQFIVAECLNYSFNPFAVDCTGRSCMDYASPCKEVEGEDMQDLINTA